jgi:hypothetical protein
MKETTSTQWAMSALGIILSLWCFALSNRIKQLEIENKNQYEQMLRMSKQTGQVVDMMGNIITIIEKQKSK